MLAAISPSCRQRKVDIEDQTHLDTNWTSRLTVEAFRLRWYYNHCSMLIVKKRICVCLLQGGKGSQHHSKGQQSLYFQYGGGWICFWFQHREHYFCFRKKWNECSDSVHFRWVFWWLVRTFTLTGSGRFAMPLLPLLPDERRLGRYGKTSKIWTQDHFTKAISASPGYVCVCVCFVCTGTAEASDSSHTNGADGVQPGSGAEEDEAHPCWDHYRPTEQQHSSTGYRQQTQGFITQHLARRLHHSRFDCFCALTRRMPGVSGCCASREDTSGECGAGATATCQPPSQHLRGPDHGLDGECGYNCSMVCFLLLFFLCGFFLQFSLNWL